MPTIAVLMHFVITPTDPSIARVHQDIQEMDKNAQVIFISEILFSYGSRYFIAYYSNTTARWIQGIFGRLKFLIAGRRVRICVVTGSCIHLPSTATFWDFHRTNLINLFCDR